MSKVTVATGNATGLPDQTAMETFAFADSGLGGFTAVVDPANPTRALTPAADGSIAVTMAAPATGGATSTKQDTGNTSVASIDGKTPALGQALAAASVPVVLTAAQLTTLTPPAALTGFATSTKQDTGNTSVASIDTKTPALGQALAASSVPVVLTASQLTTLTPPTTVTANAGSGTMAVSAASLPLPTLAATSTKQPALGTAGTASADVLSVQGVASMTPLTVGGTTSSVISSTLTRPANATPYAVGDVVNASTVTGTLQQFAGATRIASSAGYLTGLQLTTSQKACGAQMRIHLWSGSISGSSVPVDNAVFPILIGDAALYLGYVDLPPFGTEDTTSTMAIAFDDTIRKRIVSDASSIVYWQMQTKTIFTPDSAQTFILTATFEKN